jgi:Ion channel
LDGDPKPALDHQLNRSRFSSIAHVDSAPYFAQHTSGTEGDRVYFSFTVLTTTSFGDFSVATPAGHALAVIEMPE